MSRRQHRALLPRTLNTNLALKPRNRDQNTVKTALTAITVSLSLLAAVSPSEAATVTLYNGTGLPETQSPIWLVPGALNSSGAIVAPNRAPVAGGVIVNTNPANPQTEYSGYSNYNPLSGNFFNASFPTLDRNLGYSISFNVALNSSTNTTANRSAFSVTVTSSDGLSGIEIGFEPGSIIGRNADFTPGETASFNTSAPSTYTLAVQGSNYTLSSGSQIISGALRTYSFDPQASNPPLGNFNPYRVGNFLFFGDNTGQESGIFTLGAVSVTTNTANAAVPFDFNPTFGLLIVGAWTAFRHLRSKQK